MAVPTVINGDFAIPALTPGNFSNNPVVPGVGWTWEPGTTSNRCRVMGPGADGWPDQYVSLFANNSSSIESACYQDLTFDGSPVRLRIIAKRISTHGRIRVSLGDLVLIDETGVTGSWTDWHEFAWELSPAGVLRLRIANRGYTGHNVGVGLVVVESVGPVAAPGRLLCFEDGLDGLIG